MYIDIYCLSCEEDLVIYIDFYVQCSVYIFKYTYLNREVDKERGGQREVPLIIHVLVVYKSALL